MFFHLKFGFFNFFNYICQCSMILKNNEKKFKKITQKFGNTN